jgi:uncharacterized protein
VASTLFRGINFPFKKGLKALPEPVYDADLIRQSLEQIVLTGRNERVMRPDFGCDALGFVHENNNDLLAELIRTEVTSAIGRFEPRVILQDVQVTKDEDKGEVTVTLIYILVATKKPDSVDVVLPKR